MREHILVFLLSIRGEWWTPLVFLILYVGICGIGLPGLVLTLSGGVLFGTFWGTFYSWVGATLGASVAFSLSRKLGRHFVERLWGSRTFFKRFDLSSERHGFQAILTLRLVPICPFNGVNLGAGMSKIHFSDFFLGTLLGLLPPTFIYTYFADSLLSGVVGAKGEALRHVFTAGALLVLLSLLPGLYKRYKG
ncbi:MAG: TVP38/TMEM64 family protein [Elusimicrobia bacterium]|nr:TVP38/TMEM64 family protein [Elusimicrobiota bacterium]